MSRILVIDDNPSVRSLVRSALAGGAGHQVLEAADGFEGLAVARRQPPDLVLCDLFMPGLDGLETIGLLRQELPPLPVVGLGAGAERRSGADLLRVARQLGAAWVLSKPFGLEELFAAVAHLLGASGTGPPPVPRS